MKQHPHKVNTAYALLLIVLGSFGLLARYYTEGDWQFTSLIPAAFGLILLSFSKGIKNEKPLIAHLAVVFTLILVGMSVFMMSKSLIGGADFGRKHIIFSLVILGGLYCLNTYIQGFIWRKKQQTES